MNQHTKITADTEYSDAGIGPKRRWSRRHGGIAAVAVIALFGAGWKLLDQPQAQASASPLAASSSIPSRRSTPPTSSPGVPSVPAPPSRRSTVS